MYLTRAIKCDTLVSTSYERGIGVNMKRPKIIGSWSGCTHGKVQFATKEEAIEYSNGIPSQPLGWYWEASEISEGGDGTWWVVVP